MNRLCAILRKLFWFAAIACGVAILALAALPSLRTTVWRALPWGKTARATTPFSAKVVDVIDGDTVTVLREGQRIKVRIWGIDAPERDQARGAESGESLRELAMGRDAIITPKDVDKHGRLVAVVRVAGVDVGLEQVTRGWAWWFERYARRAEDLRSAEGCARAVKRGLWQDDPLVAPWDFRREKQWR